MASIFIREGKKGSQIYFDYKTPENPRKRVPSGIYLVGSKAYQKSLMAEAQLRAQTLEDEAMRDSRPIPQPIKRTECTITDFIEHAEVGQAKKTKKSIVCFKKQFIEWLRDNNLHELHFSQITREHAERYLQFLVSSMKLSSAKTYYAWIKVIFNIAVDDEQIETNPMALSRKKFLRIYKTADKQVSAKAFSIEQINSLISYGDTLVATSTMLTFLCNGRRLNEIFNLKWADIDFDEKLITFITSKTGAICHVHIGPKLERLLKELREAHGGLYVLPRHVETLKGDIHRLSPDLLSRRMRYACVSLGFIGKGFKGYSGLGHHSIRRTVETLLIEEMDFARADAIIGHAPTTLGAKHYYKPTRELYRNVSEYLESLLLTSDANVLE